MLSSFVEVNKKVIFRAGASGLVVVMGRDSCSKGHEFESQHCILDGLFSHYFL